jgi:hypothetical protein
MGNRAAARRANAAAGDPRSNPVWVYQDSCSQKANMINPFFETGYALGLLADDSVDNPLLMLFNARPGVQSHSAAAFREYPHRVDVQLPYPRKIGQQVGDPHHQINKSIHIPRRLSA